jgi:hypothetical protein
VTTHLYAVEDGPKMLRETLSRAQTALGQTKENDARDAWADSAADRERLQRLIDECERKRPTGPDGKHDDRHTPECGCEDPALEWGVEARHPSADRPLLLPVPQGRAHAEKTAEAINGDSTPASARVVFRPAVGWTEA